MPISAWAWIAPAEFLPVEHRNDLPRTFRPTGFHGISRLQRHPGPLKYQHAPIRRKTRMESKNHHCMVPVLALLALLSLAGGVNGAVRNPDETDGKLADSISDRARLQAALRTAQEENPGASECDLKWIALELRWKIAEQGGIPQWDGTRLLDASGRVCGRTDSDPAIRVLLAKLNYWERAYGTSSTPPGDRGRPASTGEERAAMARYIAELRDKGIHVAWMPTRGFGKFWMTAPIDSLVMRFLPYDACHYSPTPESRTHDCAAGEKGSVDNCSRIVRWYPKGRTLQGCPCRRWRRRKRPSTASIDGCSGA